MEMSLQRARSIGGWGLSAMTTLGQRFSFSTGMVSVGALFDLQAEFKEVLSYVEIV